MSIKQEPTIKREPSVKSEPVERDTLPCDNIQRRVNSLQTQISHLIIILEQYTQGALPLPQIESIINDSEKIIQESGALGQEVNGLISSVDSLSQNVATLGNLTLLAKQQSERGIAINFGTFKKILTIGNIEELAGTVKYAQRTQVEPHKSGKTFELRLNEAGKVRPPVALLTDEDVLTIEDLRIEAKNGVFLDLEHIKAILPAL